jgi:hypothetical protein
MKKIIISVSCVIFAAAIALAVLTNLPKKSAAADNGKYYIDSINGNDRNDGLSPESAWKTFDVANKTEFSPGSEIYLRRGGKYAGTLSPKGDGKELAPNIIGAFGEGEAPIIEGDIDAETSISAGVLLHNQNHWVIEDLKVTNADTKSEAQYGIYILADSGKTIRDISIYNCEIFGNADNWSDSTQSEFTGINVSHNETYSGYAHEIMIDSNNIHDVKGDGINVTGSIAGGDAQGNPMENSNTLVYVQRNVLKNIGKDGIVVTNCDSPVVTNNICENAHSYATDSYHVAIWGFACRNAWFSYNEVFGTKTTYDGQAFDCDYQSTGTTFMYNYAHDNEGGFMLICCEPKTWDGGVAYNNNSTVCYNIAQNNKNTQFQLTGQIKNTKIYNNTLYYKEGKSVSLYLRDKSCFPENTQFYNNVFYNLSEGGEYALTFDGVSAQNTIWSHNAFYGNHPASEPEDSAKVTEDPQFINAGGAINGINSCGAYCLSASSPLLGAGVEVDPPENLMCPENLDFFGFEYDPASPNIGAAGTLWQEVPVR